MINPSAEMWQCKTNTETKTRGSLMWKPVRWETQNERELILFTLPHLLPCSREKASCSDWLSTVIIHCKPPRKSYDGLAGSYYGEQIVKKLLIAAVKDLVRY